MRIVIIIVAILLLGGAAFVVLAPRFLNHRVESVTGVLEGEALVLEGAALRAPDTSPEQTYRVLDNGGLEISVHANQPPPTPAERGVRIVLAPERVARVNDVPVRVDVRYSAAADTAASGLAISLQGISPSNWVLQPIRAGEGVAQFDLPAEFAVDAIGLRALSETPDRIGVVTITQIRITTAPQEAPAETAEEVLSPISP